MTRAWFGNSVRRFISKTGTIARGMTDVDVGSGALFGFCRLQSVEKPIQEVSRLSQIHRPKDKADGEDANMPFAPTLLGTNQCDHPDKST